MGDGYLFGWSTWPEDAGKSPMARRQRALIWRANYRPGWRPLFIRSTACSFLVPLALPGDDVQPEQFVSFWCDGSRGLYIHPNVWHGALGAIRRRGRVPRPGQGRVHARVSIDFVKEFGGYLSVPLQKPS